MAPVVHSGRSGQPADGTSRATEDGCRCPSQRMASVSEDGNELEEEMAGKSEHGRCCGPVTEHVAEDGFECAGMSEVAAKIGFPPHMVPEGARCLA